jgi:hypothetical protein
VTEAEWLSCPDPEPMLSSLASRGAADERKLRLVACACVRQAWHLLPPPAQAAVQAAEAHAGGAASGEDLAQARGRGALGWLGEEPFSIPPRLFATWAAWSASGTAVEPVTACLGFVRRALAPGGGRRKVKRAQALVVRDLFGPLPFRPVAFHPNWGTRDVAAVAQSIHAHRAFEDLPALGDALEEGGCDCGELLNHCRNGGPHYLGCWALDLVTGRA